MPIAKIAIALPAFSFGLWAWMVKDSNPLALTRKGQAAPAIGALAVGFGILAR